MITQEMLDEFNVKMKANDSIIKLQFSNKKTVEITFCNMKFVDSYILNATSEFYNLLEEFFKTKSIVINYNNFRSCFWMA